MAADTLGKEENTGEDGNDHDDQNDEIAQTSDGSSGDVEERIRVDRRKLENMLKAALDGDLESGEHFFKKIEEETNTTISWPSKLKIGAKSKKDPHIKVAGLPNDIQKAKQMIMSVLDTKTSRVTLKMDVSFTDHSHIIGKGGNSIKKVMQETGCHIHFPDSNRTSADKSNQVSIAGPPLGVEAARDQMRKLLPIVLMFEIPSNSPVVPDSTSPHVHQIAQEFNVSINFKQRPRTFGFIGTVRGLHSDPFAVKNAILRLLEHLTGTVPVTFPVTTQIEIDPKHHHFMIGRNGNNIKQIMQSTGTSIQFPDPNGCQGRAKSTVCITGTVESAITAKVQLMECLPLVLMFDVKEDDNDLAQDPVVLNRLMEDMDVLISIKPKPRQGSKSVIIKSVEKNARRMYLARVHLLDEDPKTIPATIASLPVPPIRSNPYPPNGLGLGALGIPVAPRELSQGLLSSLGINSRSPINSPLNSKSPSPLPFRGSSGAIPSLASLVGSYNILPSDSTPQPPMPAPTTEHEALPSNAMSSASHKLQSNSPLSSSSGLPQGTLSQHNRMVPATTGSIHGSSGISSISPPSSTGATAESSLSSVRASSSEGHMMRVHSMESLGGSDSKADKSALKASNSATQLTNAPEPFLEGQSPDSLMHLPHSTDYVSEDGPVHSRNNGGTFADVILARSSPNGPTPMDNSDIYSSSLNNSWNSSKQKITVLKGVRNVPYLNSDNISPDSGLNDSQSDLSMSGSLSKTTALMERLAVNRNLPGPNYDEKKKMASRVMHSPMNFGEVRNPTSAWSGFGFSKSMPESAIKKLWSKSEAQGMGKFQLPRDFEQQSPSGSLNSSASSTSSSSSTSMNGKESPPRRRSTQGPPPGLEGSKPAFEGAALLLNNNIDFTSVLQPESSSMSTLAAVQDLGELLKRLGLDRYIENFQDQEVDLSTFMSLTDDDLKVLGVSTFGARRKMLLAIHDLQKIHVQRTTMPTTTAFPRSYTDSSQRFNPGPLPIDIASHSLRW